MVKKICFKYQLSKNLGQHFLRDKYYINKIVTFINPKHNEIMVEIGPGMGALTKPILILTDKLLVIEIDKKLVNILNKNFISKKITIFLQDILKFNFNIILKTKQSIRVFGNLPYNISILIIMHLIKFKDLFSDMNFLLQKEVALRLCAVPNTKSYGRISILTQYYFDVYLAFDIPPESFFPIPKVYSSFVRLIPKKISILSLKEINSLHLITNLAFSQRRKMIRNSLSAIFSEKDFKKLYISPLLRAENISVIDYCRLAKYWNSIKS